MADGRENSLQSTSYIIHITPTINVEDLEYFEMRKEPSTTRNNLIEVQQYIVVEFTLTRQDECLTTGDVEKVDLDPSVTLSKCPHTFLRVTLKFFGRGIV